MANATVENRKYFEKQLRDTNIEDIYDLKRLEEITNETLKLVNNSFKNDGILCTTTKRDNLLMWAHYAEQHHGAVIELKPSIARNSVLTLSKKVSYQEERPFLYKDSLAMVTHGLKMTPIQSINKILNTLIYTKSKEWSYEEEYRLWIPGIISPTEKFTTINYYPEELKSIIFGCRAEPDLKDKMMILAKTVNPSVKFYNASIAPREFNLVFTAIN